jgi:PhzF family phenazine biosynthesis protein
MSRTPTPAPTPVPLFVVDAFTAEPFHGNPAAICVLDGPADPAWMQAVAAEMKHAETAFLHGEPQRAGVLRLRWFTPRVEVDLCGHATLAAAHVLWESGRLATDATARFETRSGLLTAARRGEEIELDFPAEPATATAPPDGLLEALGLAPGDARFVGRNRMDWLVELERDEAVRALAPDFVRLARVPCRGVIVTAPSARPGCDFLSRFFAPAAGIDEDPVTGSAHCCLAPFWRERLAGRGESGELVGFQASERGGFVRVRLAGARVMLRGRAVTVVRGELVGPRPPVA